MGYRIDDAEQVLAARRGPPAGSVIADAHAKAVTHLLGDHGIWEPAGLELRWAEGLQWYRPEDGDDGLPLAGTGGPMSDRQVTGFLVKVIDKAIENRDFPLTETAIGALATIDPDKAQDVLDMIRSVAALMIREEAP